MLNETLRRIASVTRRAGWAALYAFSLLRPWWFIAAGAAVVIYWVVFTPHTATQQGPQAGPGQYLPPPTPPVPGPAAGAGASTPHTPVIVPLPQSKRPSAGGAIQAVAVPELAGIEPPPLPPPLPEQPFGVVRGYKPPLPPPSKWPF